jgi:hypothetical protein
MRTALQQALFTLLDGNLTWGDSAAVVPVYDSVPQRTASPYVTIGEDNLEPVDTDDSRGAEGIAELTVWTGKEHAGRKVGKEIADQIYALAHQAKPTVAGYTLAALFWDSSENFDEVDGATRRTVEGYRVLLQE